MELMEELYKDKQIKAECKPVEDYVKDYERITEPIVTKILCDFGLILDLGYTIWHGYCVRCAAI